MKKMKDTIKIYNGCPISEEGTRTLSIVTAQEVAECAEKHGESVDIFVPAVQPFNDKANGEPTPRDIYKGDIERLRESNIALFNLTGGLQDGTNSEIGVVTGMNESIVSEMIGHKLDFDIFETRESWDKALRELLIVTFAYSTASRVPNPQHFYGIASASVNHLILGMLDEWGIIFPTRKAMIDTLEEKGVEKLREEVVQKISNAIIEENQLSFVG